MIISYDISISLIFKIKSYEAQKTFLFDLVGNFSNRNELLLT